MHSIIFFTTFDLIIYLIKQAGGGLEGMKWLLSDMEKEEILGYPDPMAQLSTAGQKSSSYCAPVSGYAVPLSARQSFSSMTPLSER